MTDFSQALDIAASGMRAQAVRLRHVSENIANADTPGYRRKTVGFRLDAGPGRIGAGSAGPVATTPVRLDPAPPERIHDPAHRLADASGYYDGSNVNLIVEISDAREAQRSYEANLKLFDQVRQMSSALTDLLRK